MSRTAAAAVATAFLLALPVAAHGAGWPMFGGDAGHSGHQPVDTPQLPAALAWHAAESAAPRTGAVLIGVEAAADRRLAYGTSGGGQARVHVRRLADGAETVPADQQVIATDADAFGDSNEAITPVDTSGALPGQLFVVHNEDNADSSQAAPACFVFPGTAASNNDISIAQYDLASGERVLDAALGRALGNGLCETQPQVSDGYAVDASPVLSPPLDSSGARSLFFVARRVAGGAGRLFRVDIPSPQDRDSGVDLLEPEFRDVEGLNSKASPTLAFLRDPETAEVRLFVVVTRNAGSDVVAYRANDLASDVVIDVAPGIAGHPQTVTAPVAADGQLAAPAPVLYAAYDDGTQTRVRGFAQEGNASRLVEPREPATLEGDPAAALASDAEALYVATSAGLSRVDLGSLATEATLAGAFVRNTPVASGGLVFVQADDGSQLVLDDGLEPVPPEDFSETAENGDATAAFGQPGYAAGALAFLSDRGAFLYRTEIAPPPPPPGDGDGDGDGDGGGAGDTPNQPPTASFIFAPNPGKAGQLVGFDASGSRDPDGTIARYQWDLDGNGSFETDGGAKPGMLGIYPAGVHTVRLRVTDNRGGTADALRQITVIGETATKPGRVRPSSVVMRVKPRRDRRPPFSFRVTGRLRAPAGLSRTAACRGRVSVTAKAGGATVLRRTARLRRNCTFKTRLRFRTRERFGVSRSLRISARFAGNRVLLARNARSRSVRVR